MQGCFRSQLCSDRWGHPPRGGSRDRSRSRSRDYRDELFSKINVYNVDHTGMIEGEDEEVTGPCGLRNMVLLPGVVLWSYCLEKYGSLTRTDYRVTVENLSSKVSHHEMLLGRGKYHLARLAGRTWRTSWGQLERWLFRKCPFSKNASITKTLEKVPLNQPYLLKEGHTAVNQSKVTFADAHKSRRNEGTVEFASRRDMEVSHFFFACVYDQNTSRICFEQLFFAVLILFCRRQLRNWMTPSWMEGGSSWSQRRGKEQICWLNWNFLSHLS